MTDLTMTRGDTNRYRITIVAPDINEVNQPVDLDNVTQLWFKVASDWETPDATALVFKTIGDGIVVSSPASAGIAIVTIDPDETEELVGLQRWVWDIQMLESNDITTTVDYGYMTLVRETTRALV